MKPKIPVQCLGSHLLALGLASLRISGTSTVIRFFKFVVWLGHSDQIIMKEWEWPLLPFGRMLTPALGTH